MKSVSLARLNPWREIAILMIILMEVCWVTPWFRAMTTETYAVSPLRVFIILTCIVMFSHVLVRIMDYLHLKKSIRQGVMVFFLLLGIFVGIKTMLYPHEAMSLSELLTRPLRNFADLKSLIPVEFIVMITVLVGFWRGLSIAQEHIGPSSVMDHFWIGIVMYLAFIFFNTMVTGETPGDFFFLFLFASLIAMCAARLTVVGMLHGGRENRFNRFWFIGIILTASIIVGVSAFFGGVVGDKFAWIGVILFSIFGTILILIWLLINPFLTLLLNLLTGVFQSENIKSLGNNLQNLNQMIQELGKRILNLVGASGINDFFTRWGSTIKQFIFIAIVILFIVGVIAWMAITLWKDRQRYRATNQQSINIQGDNPLQILLNLFRQGWAGALNSLEFLTDFNHRRKLRAAARIRQVYADLMELCDSLEHPRADAETPLEFIPKLDQLFPELQLEVVTITEAYNRVRYGQLPETRQEVQDVEAAWNKIYDTGKKLLSELKHAKKKSSSGL